MNRNKLKQYAPQARRDFIAAVTDRAAHYGLTKGNIEPITEQGEVALIGGTPFPRHVAAKRKRLEERINRQGFEQVMEAMAYTWFNRLVAIRYMELHGYLDHGYRVLSYPEGKTTPEIIEHAEHVDLPGLDTQKVIDLKLDGTKEAELYRMLLVAQCNALHRAMPFLFERINDETELLLPDNLLHSDSLIRKLVNAIDEEDWQEVEIIGWLYQFYISEKKDEVIGKVVKSEDIPAATQLFTPNWIVKYLVQNTLGHQWIATYPDSRLKDQMEFYIEPAKQTPEVQAQLKEITPDSLNPEELTLLDPACGSGHILVEAYDLLKAIYLERGYRARDIPRLILEKNLYGLEIDDRAAQLSAFALMMKACEDDRRIFSSDVKPHVLAIQESKGLDAKQVTEALNAPILKTDLAPSEYLFDELEEERAPLFSRKNLAVKGEIDQKDVARLIELFEHGKTFGSLIRVPKELAQKLLTINQRIEDVLDHGGMLEQASARSISKLIEQSRILTTQFHTVVANPPYINRKYMSLLLKEFLEGQYKSFKTDVFSAFICRNIEFTYQHHNIGMVTPYLWMFNSSYSSVRDYIIEKSFIISLIQLEYNAFGPAVVPVCTFILQSTPGINARGDYINLSEFRGIEVQPVKVLEAVEDTECCWRYQVAMVNFEGLPSRTFAYWISPELTSIFRTTRPLSEIADAKQGLSTADTDRFLRRWFEVNFIRIGFSCSDAEYAKASGRKWFPHCKGGGVRRWYGNHEWVINWYDEGREIKAFPKSVVRNSHYYFKSGITWCDLTSSFFTARELPQGFIFDTAGPALFAKKGKSLDGILAYLNSRVFQSLVDIGVQGLHYNNGVVSSTPASPNFDKSNIIDLERKIVSIFQRDWNDSELSWDFSSFPLLRHEASSKPLALTWLEYDQRCKQEIQLAWRLEVENNVYFIDAYSLQDELSPEVSEDKITLYRPDQEEDTKRLISYAIGCMMGRYSLDKPGLIYAHSGNQGFDANQYQTFSADDDGIIPITDDDWFPDDAANRVEEFIAVAWPQEHLEENLKFIAESLGPNRNEQSRDTIRRYLATGFFKHHLSMYKKRPIYWLFSSGKQRAFQCLVYLHRYNEGTLSRMRTVYVIPLQGKIASRITQLEDDIAAATSTSHRKRLEKERDKLLKQQAELQSFDEKLRHYADRRISLDLDDGVKVNYGKFGDLLSEVKVVT